MDYKGNNDLRAITISLLRWAKKEDFKGFDPYDGLNSFLFYGVPFRNKYWGILITQFFKRFPLNLRPFFGIRKMRNAKGISLYIMGLLNLYRSYRDEKYLSLAAELAKWLLKNRSPYTERYAWGYNFPWQSRNSFKPEFYPNVVTTVFCAESLLELYMETGESRLVDIVESSGEFILNELNRYEDERGICFSYGPGDSERVYNATLLASMLLADLWSITGRNKYIDYALKSAEFVVKSQNEDGSWYYGDVDNQKWIDNFHTGYNLWALLSINEKVNHREIYNSIKAGYRFYRENLFTEDFIPRNTIDSLYPLDIHAFAVSSLVFGMFEDFEYQERVLKNAINIFYSDEGYFYYRDTGRILIRIPYMRWSNGWMFLALTDYLLTR